MNLLFYIGHPAHYHNFKNVIVNLKNAGFNPILVVRPKDVVLDLIEELDVLKFILPEKSGTGKVALVKDVIQRNILLLKLKFKYSIELMIGTDLAISQIAKITGARSIVVNEDDAEAVPLFAKTAYPTATKILAPIGCSTGKYEFKTIRYNGYHELAYLHPDHFQANVETIQKEDLKAKDYAVLRFSALNAHHDNGVEGINDDFALRIVKKIESKYQVVITSERPLSAELEPYRMKFHPSKMHDVLAFSKVFVGDSQTMAAEAMVLGTPSIRCNGFVGRLAYLEELENVYQLGFGVLPSNREEIFQKLDHILSNENLEEEWDEKRKVMLSQKINVAYYWTDLFSKLAQA